MNEHSNETRASFGKFVGVGFLLFVIGLVWWGIMAGQDRAVAMQAYHYGWLFWTGLTLGCLGLMILHHTIRATWSLAIVRLLEAGGGPVALLISALGFVPIALFRHDIFPWTHADHIDHVLEAKQWWLNEPRFYISAGIYFAIWIGLSLLLRSSSLKEDRTHDPKLGAGRSSWGAAGIVIYVVTVTLAVTDWVMSLEPHWFSTILGLLFIVGQALTALSLAVILTVAKRDSEPYHSIITPKLTKDWGNMLFALTMLWGYFTLSQFLITWAGNLPEEVPYYIARSTEGWNILGSVLIGFQFFFPFFALLAPRMKRYARALVIVASVILLMRFADMFWTVMPAFTSGHGAEAEQLTFEGAVGRIANYAALLMFGGLWFAVFGSQVKAGSLVPEHDMRLMEATDHA